MKKLGLIFAMMALMMSFAWAAPTVVNGIVYSGADIFSPEVVGATVDVTCEGNAAASVTNDIGYYAVAYAEGECDVGEVATACVESICESAEVPDDGFVNLNILGIDLFNVPEFSFITASVALAGSIILFVALRKRK